MLKCIRKLLVSIIFVLSGLVIALSITNLCSAFPIVNSSSYVSYVDIGIGGLLNSSNYISQISMEDIIGDVNSTNYKANFGFIATVSGKPALLLSLNYPADGASVTSGTVNFNWSATGVNPKCNLSVDSVIRASNVTSPNGTAVNYSVLGLSDGTHYWNVSCWGAYGSANVSDTWSFSISTAVPPTPPSGPAGGAGGEKKIENIILDTSEINLDMVVDSVKERIVRVINKGLQNVWINIKKENLEASLSSNSFILSADEYKDIRIVFKAPREAGIYTGKIIVNGKEILVSLNVHSGLLLFDASIIVPDAYKQIKPGDKLNAQITLIPMGENPNVDVTLNYIIKDFSGKTYSQESETMLVDKQKNFEKQFSTLNLPVGDYVVGLEVIYPNGVATSSSHFSVVEKIPMSATQKLFIAISIVLIVGLLVFIIIRYKKLKRHG